MKTMTHAPPARVSMTSTKDGYSFNVFSQAASIGAGVPLESSAGAAGQGAKFFSGFNAGCDPARLGTTRA